MKLTVLERVVGEFEDKSYQNLGVFLCSEKELINQIIQQKKLEDINFQKIRDKIRAFKEKWQDSNPNDGMNPTKTVPKWRAGITEKEITPEMRSERNALKEENERIAKRNSELQEAWMQRRKLACNQYLLEMGIDPEEHDKYTEYSWSEFDPVEYITSDIEASGELLARLTDIESVIKEAVRKELEEYRDYQEYLKSL